MTEFILSLLYLQPRKQKLKGPICLPTKFLELAISFHQICEQQVQEGGHFHNTKNIDGQSK